MRCIVLGALSKPGQSGRRGGIHRWPHRELRRAGSGLQEQPSRKSTPPETLNPESGSHQQCTGKACQSSNDTPEAEVTGAKRRQEDITVAVTSTTNPHKVPPMDLSQVFILSSSGASPAALDHQAASPPERVFLTAPSDHGDQSRHAKYTPRKALQSVTRKQPRRLGPVRLRPHPVLLI